MDNCPLITIIPPITALTTKPDLVDKANERIDRIASKLCFYEKHEIAFHLIRAFLKRQQIADCGDLINKWAV